MIYWGVLCIGMVAGDTSLRGERFTRSFAEYSESWQLTSDSGAAFPLSLSPAEEFESSEEFRARIHENRNELLRAALDHGAILFRGFPIDNPSR
jgi:hypothetical protein